MKLIENFSELQKMIFFYVEKNSLYSSQKKKDPDLDTFLQHN